MYKSKKISFDKVFFGKVDSKIETLFFILPVFALFGLIYLIYISRTSHRYADIYLIVNLLAFLCLIPLFRLGRKFMQGYKVTLGINNEGVYSSYWDGGVYSSYWGGWILWKKIIDVQVKKCGWIKKQDCIYLKIREVTETKNIRLIYQSIVDEPVQDIAKLIKEYIEKYGEK